MIPRCNKIKIRSVVLYIVEGQKQDTDACVVLEIIAIVVSLLKAYVRILLPSIRHIGIWRVKLCVVHDMSMVLWQAHFECLVWGYLQGLDC